MKKSDTYILQNGLVMTNSGFHRCDILVSDGHIIDIRENISNIYKAVVIDCFSFVLLPGLVDVHVHLREPGFEYKETIKTGTQAAARGGYTLVCPMPNLNPVPDSIENLKVEVDAIKKDAVIKVVPYASITIGRKGKGEIVDMKSILENYQIAGFSDDGCGVQTEDDMRVAMEKCAQVSSKIVAHCEVNELLKGGYIHDGEYCKAHNHKGICSESEWKQIERDLKLVEETSCEYHVCHISTKESVELIRKAKAKNLKVSAETAPHYLLLSDKDLQEDGRFKMNPPLRSEADKEALIKGLEDGTIDCIATDHAPHSAEEKSKGLEKSAMGIVGIETAFPLLYTHFVRTGKWTLKFLIEKMSLNPRKLFGFAPVEGLEVGMRADIAVFNLDDEYVINPQAFISKGKSTPFEGWKVYGKCMLTMVDGEIAYQSVPLTKPRQAMDSHPMPSSI